MKFKNHNLEILLATVEAVLALVHRFENKRFNCLEAIFICKEIVCLSITADTFATLIMIWILKNLVVNGEYGRDE
jgi:hypothetical protein